VWSQGLLDPSSTKQQRYIFVLDSHHGSSRIVTWSLMTEVFSLTRKHPIEMISTCIIRCRVAAAASKAITPSSIFSTSVLASTSADYPHGSNVPYPFDRRRLVDLSFEDRSTVSIQSRAGERFSIITNVHESMRASVGPSSPTCQSDSSPL
jgi:hypothetical protein